MSLSKESALFIHFVRDLAPSNGEKGRHKLSLGYINGA
jgi:hypothetical protein